MRQFEDIVLSEAFISDYDALPKDIKCRIDKRVSVWALTGEIPPSAQAHRTNTEIWIFYLSVSSGAFRLLGEIKDKKLYLYRVGDHALIDRILRAND